MHNITTDTSAPQALRKIVCFGIHKKPPRRRRVRKFGLIESHVSRKSDHSMEGGVGGGLGSRYAGCTSSQKSYAAYVLWGRVPDIADFLRFFKKKDRPVRLVQRNDRGKLLATLGSFAS